MTVDDFHVKPWLVMFPTRESLISFVTGYMDFKKMPWQQRWNYTDDLLDSIQQEMDKHHELEKSEREKSEEQLKISTLRQQCVGLHELRSKLAQESIAARKAS